MSLVASTISHPWYFNTLFYILISSEETPACFLQLQLIVTIALLSFHQVPITVGGLRQHGMRSTGISDTFTRDQQWEKKPQTFCSQMHYKKFNICTFQICFCNHTTIGSKSIKCKAHMLPNALQELLVFEITQSVLNPSNAKAQTISPMIS